MEIRMAKDLQECENIFRFWLYFLSVSKWAIHLR